MRLQKIVFLDTSTVDYGDIDFTSLSSIGDFTPYELTKPGEVVERLNSMTVAITNKVVFDDAVFDRCKDLRLIAVSATGYNNIDIPAARARGIAVANVPSYSTYSVAQLTMTFILSLATRLVEYNRAAHNGTWSASPSFTLNTWKTFDLQDKVIGILGMGDIGRTVAGMCRAFGMRVRALKREGASYDDDIPRLNLHSLAEESDFISIHMPLTDYSRHIINGEIFKRMKRSAFLINMARGPIVDPIALAHALQSGMIAGAAVDVMEKEPPAADDPLLKSPNLIITPHIAWASFESRKKLVSEIAQNIESFFKGGRRNRVD